MSFDFSLTGSRLKIQLCKKLFMKMNYSHPHMTTNINKIPEKKSRLAKSVPNHNTMW